jgi:aminopeptidase YwaD
MSKHSTLPLYNLFSNANFFPFLAFILYGPLLFSQEKGEVFQYARQIVDTLASPSMHGRGYVNKGEKLAANYLGNEFKKLGLKSFRKNYNQEFELPVNTFPGDMRFQIVSTKMEDPAPPEMHAGIDFLVDPASPSLKGKFQTIRLNNTVLYRSESLYEFQKERFQKTLLYIDTLGLKTKINPALLQKLLTNPPEGIAGFVFQDNPQSRNTPGPWDVSQVQNRLPLITSRQTKDISGTTALMEVDIEAKFISRYTTQNLIGYIQGSQYPDSFIVFTAHYDHLGQMGKSCYFPGANDNASGCALLLDLAKYYAAPEHKPKCSVAFMAFSAEEAGLVGSKYYTEHPLFPLKQIKFLVNMDIMGTGDEGITVVNGTLFPAEFSALQSINEKGKFLNEVKIRGKAANSDHYFFTEKGVRAFFIYTRGGIKAYHDVLDKRETLPLSKIEDVFRLLTGFESWEEEKK